MKTILFLYGTPGSGKSWLAEKLKATRSFEILKVDSLYVEFVKESFPNLYFEMLDKFIQPHYDSMKQCRQYSNQVLKSDFISDWHIFLRKQILHRAESHDKLVVDGYQLVDFKDGFQADPPENACVHAIEVTKPHQQDRQYRLIGKPLTIEQIAELK